jgi:hypothetical protein
MSSRAAAMVGGGKSLGLGLAEDNEWRWSHLLALRCGGG